MSVMAWQIIVNSSVCLIGYSGLTTKKSLMPALLTLCEGIPPQTGGFPSQRVSNTCHDVIMLVEGVEAGTHSWFTRSMPSRLTR